MLSTLNAVERKTVSEFAHMEFIQLYYNYSHSISAVLPGLKRSSYFSEQKTV